MAWVRAGPKPASSSHVTFRWLFPTPASSQPCFPAPAGGSLTDHLLLLVERRCSQHGCGQGLLARDEHSRLLDLQTVPGTHPLTTRMGTGWAHSACQVKARLQEGSGGGAGGQGPCHGHKSEKAPSEAFCEPTKPLMSVAK